MEKRIADLRNRVKTAEQNAFQMLVELFDWLDSLEPQRTTEIVTRSQEREIMSAVPPSPMAIDSAVSCSPCTRIFFFSFSLGIGDEPMVNSKFIKTPMVTEEK